MKIILSTCDYYRNILEANKFTMDKYGGADLDVTILGYKKPEFDMGSWKFVSLGEDTGAQNFTNDIWKFFKDFDEKFFIYGSEDWIVVDEIDLDLFQIMETTMKENPNVMKICGTSAGVRFPNHTIYKDMGDFKYIELPQNADYRLAIHLGVWRTSYFKKHFEFNISPWEWETRDNAKNDGANILATSGRHLFDFGHIFRKGGRINNNWHKSEYTNKELSQTDIEFVLNIIKKI